MGQVIPLRRRRRKSRVKGKEDVLTLEEFEALDLERRVALIQELIPLGLMAAAAELQREVEELAGIRYGRKEGEGEGAYRFGSHSGTVLLGGQRVPIRVPRVRTEDGEIRLRSYELLHRGVAAADDRLMERVLYGVSCRNYEATVGRRQGAIGTSKSTVVRGYRFSCPRGAGWRGRSCALGHVAIQHSNCARCVPSSERRTSENRIDVDHLHEGVEVADRSCLLLVCGALANQDRDTSTARRGIAANTSGGSCLHPQPGRSDLEAGQGAERTRGGCGEAHRRAS